MGHPVWQPFRVLHAPADVPGGLGAAQELGAQLASARAAAEQAQHQLAAERAQLAAAQLALKVRPAFVV